MEAIRALFGHLPSYNPALLTGATAQTPQEELVSNRMRIRSWSMVASQVRTDIQLQCLHFTASSLLQCCSAPPPPIVSDWICVTMKDPTSNCSVSLSHCLACKSDCQLLQTLLTDKLLPYSHPDDLYMSTCSLGHACRYRLWYAPTCNTCVASLRHFTAGCSRSGVCAWAARGRKCHPDGGCWGAPEAGPA